MSDTAHTPRVSEMPAQHPAAPETAAQSRARFFNSGNAFDVKLPEVPDMAFVDEPATALNPETDTGVIDCDISEQLECAFPATSPLVLASYARIRAEESLTMEPRASGIIAYVIQGDGVTECNGEEITWKPGDIMLFPGGTVQNHQAGDEDAVLWVNPKSPSRDCSPLPEATRRLRSCISRRRISKDRSIISTNMRKKMNFRVTPLCCLPSNRKPTATSCRH
jgi:hypothetical protein